MDRKFVIILFATVFFNGVTHSSPVGQQTLDARLPEEKPPTVQPPTVDHINSKKIEPVSTTKPTVPVTQSASQPTTHIEVSTPKSGTIHDLPVNTVAPHTDVKNGTHDAVNKNATQVVDNKAVNQTTNGTNVTPAPANASTNAQPMDNKNKTVPATDKNTGDMPIPTPAGQSTTASSTTTVTVAPPKSSTAKSSTAGPTVTPVAPSNATSKDNVITGQNTPAPPAQENHFHAGSFVGGIVLAIGLTAIGFIAFKYYKSGKIDMNYRTL